MTGHPHHPASLYHYTCSHAVEFIRRDGLIRPAAQLGVDDEKWAKLSTYEQQAAEGIRQFVWLTDLAPPAPGAPLGLNRVRLQCDRTACCFEVVPDWQHVRWWMKVRREYPDLRAGLEWESGVLPMHWFVSEEPVPIYRELDARNGREVKCRVRK